MDTQEEETHDTAGSITLESSSQAVQSTHATPIRHRGESSAAVSSSKCSTISKINLGDIVTPIKNEISKPQDCKATDMLRFLFSFCNTAGNAAQVEPKDDELIKAFEMVREFANESKTPLRENLDLAITAKDEVTMYTPLIKAFNYALDRLSEFNIPGLPEFQEERQIVFARSDAKCIGSEHYLQGLYKPDIILVKWNVFTKVYKYPPRAAYSESYRSSICCESGRHEPKLSWPNILSTVEVKRGDTGGAGRDGNKQSKGKAKEKSVLKSMYTEDFWDQGDLGMAGLSKLSQSAPPKMVGEEYSTRLLGTRTGLRSQGIPSSTSDRPLFSSQKRRRDLQEIHETVQKKARSDGYIQPGGTGAQREEIPGGLSAEKPNEPEKPQKQAPKVQSAIYASHKISSSFDISHTINLILIGTSVHLTWIDRQNVIESRVIDLVDDLPHFLLLLLILQRFDGAKWGYFTECPQSGIGVEPGELFTVSFVADAETGEKITIVFYPHDHAIYLGTTLIGRGTSVTGGRIGPPPEPTQLEDTNKLREGNDIVIKTYWPEENRTSEVEILKKAKEYGEKIDFIGNHIPEMVCHLDPDFLWSSTKTVRQFLGLPTDGSRRLRIIVFRRLLPIKELKENDMLTAYFQCFVCHFCLWKKGIRHGDISIGNLMWDNRRRVGVLNDFDLARFADQTGASGQDNTGTLPFMALDLLSGKGLRGEIPRRYRHEAESFTWSLICLYFATLKDKKGKNYTGDPHPLLEWFQGWKGSRDAKKGLEWDDHDITGIPLAHPNTRELACALHTYWLDRYIKQFPRPSKKVDRPPRLGGAFNVAVSTTEYHRYEEPEDDRVFQEVLVEHEVALHAEPLQEIRDDLVNMGLKCLEIDWDA